MGGGRWIYYERERERERWSEMSGARSMGWWPALCRLFGNGFARVEIGGRRGTVAAVRWGSGTVVSAGNGGN